MDVLSKLTEISSRTGLSFSIEHPATGGYNISFRKGGQTVCFAARNNLEKAYAKAVELLDDMLTNEDK